LRAAVLHDFGAVPEPGEFEDPAGEAIVDVTAAGLNPIDLRIASGQLAGVRPPLPSVVGREGVGLLPGGRRVYFDGVAAPFGSIAERCPIDPAAAVEVPDGLEDAHAVCYGVAGLAAWLALERGRLAAGETVLVLGASGVVGMIAVQAAKLLGAGRVVAAARSDTGLERASELGADATVKLDAPGDLAGAMREAAAGDLHLVVDPLWGEPAAAAVEALAFRGRLVQLGQSAGATAELSSMAIRFRELEILGHTNFATPGDVRRVALTRMFSHAAAGELVADYEVVALEDVADAWRRQAASPNVKLVVAP
jgi:NADPH:quinone reductase